MKICFIPIDNRPVCYNLAKNICAIDSDIELYIPPREYLGDLKKTSEIDSIFNWLKNISECEIFIISLDTLAYGGLIPSRRSKDSFLDVKNRIEQLKPILKGKKVYAFSSIMRISNNNHNEEEKEYWSEYGKKIFEYSYSGGKLNNGIPKEILEDYLETRKRNFEINKLYLEWQKEGLFDTLIFSKDDCAPKGFNVDEARELENLGGKTKTGADEIPLTLLAKALKKNINVYIEFTEPDYINCISNYEDISIEKSVLGQLELAGFNIVKAPSQADLILIVNNFIEKQGELVMNWDTIGKYRNNIVLPDKPFAIADVRYANGADNDFIETIIDKINTENFYGYSGWNTSANAIGSLLACIKAKWKANRYNNNAFKNLQIIRFLDDWAYQANVRKRISNQKEIKALMKPFEERLGTDHNIQYSFPWNRFFEIELTL